MVTMVRQKTGAVTVIVGEQTGAEVAMEKKKLGKWLLWCRLSGETWAVVPDFCTHCLKPRIFGLSQHYSMQWQERLRYRTGGKL